MAERGSCDLDHLLTTTPRHRPPIDHLAQPISNQVVPRRPGRVAEWLARRTHDLLIAGSSPTCASNILGQDMNPVGRPAMLTVKRSATCSTRGGSQGTYITFASGMRIRQPALALKPRGDVTRNPKQGYQWPQNRTCVCVRQKYLKKKKKSST